MSTQDKPKAGERRTLLVVDANSNFTHKGGHKAAERLAASYAEENDSNSTYCEQCGCRITGGQCKHGVRPPPKAGEPPTQAHTPGPWTYLANAIVTVGIPGKGSICTLRETPCEGGLHLSPEIAEANARLIAAAPKMLEALKYISDTQLSLRQILEAARDAIEQAEGK